MFNCFLEKLQLPPALVEFFDQPMKKKRPAFELTIK